MIWLGRLAMRGRLQAAVTAAAATWLLMPLSAVVGNGVVALVALRQGPREGSVVLVIGGIGLALLGVIVFGAGGPGAAASMLLANWLPVLVLASVLRVTVSLPLTLLTAGGLGVLALVVVQVMLGDPAAWWTAVLMAFRPIFEDMGISLDPAAYEALVRAQAPYLTGYLVAGQLFAVVGGLLLGRYWQAGLYNPGGFGEEFRELRLGRSTAAATAGLMLAAWVTGAPFVVSLALIAGALMVFQGIAVLHGVIHKAGMATGWLVAFYILLVVAMPQMLLLACVMGLVDGWADFRARVGSRS